MAPPLPMGPCKARTIRLGGDAVGSFVWGAKKSPVKNREKDGASALGGRRLIKQTPNNQPRVRGSSRGDVGEKARWVASLAYGGHGAILWGDDLNIEQ